MSTTTPEMTPSPSVRWVINRAYDWEYIQSLRILAGGMLQQEGRDDQTRTLAQSVLDLTDELYFKEHKVLKALSSRRLEPDVS